MTDLMHKLRMGMVGGGPGAFIGDVHHKAAIMDGNAELVAGAFSSSPRKSKQKGRELGLPPKRVYNSYDDMLEGELRLPPEERIHFVSVVTPNHVHFPVAKSFLESGFHVVCDKPMTLNLPEARRLVKIVTESRKVFALTHNYTGYPMVKCARDLVAQKKLGPLRKVVVQYPQGWLSTPLERTKQKQAEWRTDPNRSGAAGCMGDIGTHAANLAEYITGKRIVEVCADLTTFVPKRKLDDDGNVLLRFENKVKGLLHASQISVGEENGLSICVYGEEAGLEWRQERPNTLLFKPVDRPVEIWSRGQPYVEEVSAAAARATRIPPGHPEGYLEAFANIYSNVFDVIRARADRRKPDPLAFDFPGAQEGLRGMLFIDALLKSNRAKQKWTVVPKR